MIGKLQNSITVRKLYKYALEHNYLDTEVHIVLDIINRERNNKSSLAIVQSTPTNTTSTIDFNTLVEYSIEDLLTLLNT